MDLDSKILNIEHLRISKEEIDRVFLKAAYDYAFEHSEDITTKTGAVISRYNQIKAKGKNHFVLGAKNLENRHEKPLKYVVTIHAEEDAITNAGSKGTTLANTIMHMPWIPCTPCYRMIENSKIKKLVVHKEMVLKSPEHWIKDLNMTLYLAKMANFNIVMYEGKIGQGTKSLFNGIEWEP